MKISDNLAKKFVRWYRITHWGYEDDWLLSYDEGRFTHPETQAMFVAYKAGYNRFKKEIL